MTTRLLDRLMGTTAMAALAPDDGARAGGASHGASAVGEPPAPTRPEAFGESYDPYWDDKAGIDHAKLATDHDELVKYKADNDDAVQASAARQADVPEELDGYEPELADDFQRPDGYEFDIPADDPVLAAAREFAKKANLTKAEFKQMMGLRAGLDLAETEAMVAQQKVELEKLGTEGTARVDGLQKRLDARIKGDGESTLKGLLFTAAQVEEMEGLVKAGEGQGPGYSGAGRDTEDPPTLTPEKREKMSPAERLNYAHQNPVTKREAA